MDQGDEPLAREVFNEIRALTRRARVARIELPALPNPGSQVWHILLMESQWPMLEKFTISAIPNYETGILEHIPLSASLTTLYLKDFWLEWSAVDPIVPSLRTVTLAPSHIRKITPRHLVTAVEKMPNVEELELVAVELSTRHADPVTLLCPNLHKLRVRLKLPLGSERILTFRVPSLLEAKFKLMDWGRPGVALHLLRTSLNAPALCRLSLATFTHIDEEWLRALKEFRCLEELRLKVLGKVDGQVTKEFLEGFTVAGPSGWTCPRLVCLRLKYSYSYYDWVPPALLKLVRARNAAAAGNAGVARLQQVTLRWVQFDAAERVDAFEASLRELLS
ncbi:hypothetical protein EXIGLDRAFT_731763 [Exidia glandulosa HHB12029]|uniref:F-box domain-containing protein n=1 Tax=Exidia glandulosa HHB12029 TaxID=1314781 RepID=A0A165BRC1_EXIGL|nr:hypothetical protein EXIGLDRAFT_731763 [Exidia glandulosa HHB12029]